MEHPFNCNMPNPFNVGLRGNVDLTQNISQPIPCNKYDPFQSGCSAVPISASSFASSYSSQIWVPKTELLAAGLGEEINYDCLPNWVSIKPGVQPPILLQEEFDHSCFPCYSIIEKGCIDAQPRDPTLIVNPAPIASTSASSSQQRTTFLNNKCPPVAYCTYATCTGFPQNDWMKRQIPFPSGTNVFLPCGCPVHDVGTRSYNRNYSNSLYSYKKQSQNILTRTNTSINNTNNLNNNSNINDKKNFNNCTNFNQNKTLEKRNVNRFTSAKNSYYKDNNNQNSVSYFIISSLNDIHKFKRLRKKNRNLRLLYLQKSYPDKRCCKFKTYYAPKNILELDRSRFKQEFYVFPIASNTFSGSLSCNHWVKTDVLKVLNPELGTMENLPKWVSIKDVKIYPIVV